MTVRQRGVKHITADLIYLINNINEIMYSPLFTNLLVDTTDANYKFSPLHSSTYLCPLGCPGLWQVQKVWWRRPLPTKATDFLA